MKCEIGEGNCYRAAALSLSSGYIWWQVYFSSPLLIRRDFCFRSCVKSESILANIGPGMMCAAEGVNRFVSLQVDSA